MPYYYYDGQLSTRQLSDVSGQVTDTYTYDAFGLLLNGSGSTENNYLYTGEQYDPNCGFYYLRARYYNASVGRFLTMDTFPGMQFEPASLHKYLYCEGGPVGRWDPSGVFHMSTTMMVALTFGIAMILTNIVFTPATHLISYFLLRKEPAKWTGWQEITTFGKFWVFGLITASFTGSHSKVEPKYGSGRYIIILSGLGIGSPFNHSLARNVELETPGMFGADPWSLFGPVIWASGALSWGKGYAYTMQSMGFGVTPAIKEGEIEGYDLGAEIMGGWSFKI